MLGRWRLRLGPTRRAASGELFIAMGYYGCETLAQKLQRGPLSIPAAIDVTRKVALGLAKAHAQGIVHRDIKPENIFLSAGRPWCGRRRGLGLLRHWALVAGRLVYYNA